MRQRIKSWLCSFDTWCSTHHKILTIVWGVITLGVAITLGFHFLPAWKVWLGIWVASVITPIVLGMLGKQIGFRWVVLWECVMFLPVVLILIFFIQDIRSYVLKGGKA